MLIRGIERGSRAGCRTRRCSSWAAVPYEGKLRAIAELAPAGSVFFSGQVSEHDLPRYYAVGDVFAMPCRTRLAGMEVEGWGNVFMEAAACAKPVVVGDSGGARETLIDGETGLLVDGTDVDRVADAVADLLGRPRSGRAMGEAGRARVLARFTWPAVAARLALWLQAACSLSASPPGPLRGVPWRHAGVGAGRGGRRAGDRRCPDCGALVSEDAAGAASASDR